MSIEARDHDDVPDDDSAAEIEEDLLTLKAMDIEHDFNSWSDFRSTLSIPKRESLESLFSRSSIAYKTTREASESFEGSIFIAEGDFNNSEEDDTFDYASGSGSDSNYVSFSSLTPGERRDIRAWNIRLSRGTVFSRYYFPEQWELRELKTIENFLDLINHEVQCLYNEPGQETTKNTIANIFSPGDHDPKSVLLKRGPILCDGGNERELMLFTHNFLVSKMEFNSLLHILFTINSENPQYLNTKQLEDRFNAIDTDQNGSLDRCELKEVFKGMGVPISESALSDILDRFDDDGDGLIDFEEFRSVMHALEPKKEEKRWTLGSLGEKIKKSISGSKVDPKVECAYPLSDIQKLECINFCHSESTKVYVDSSWAELVFAIFVKGREVPLIVVCSKAEHCRAWVDAFGTCLVKSIQVRADNGSSEANKLRALPGWQHRIIRASLFSLVCIGDLAGLKRQLANPAPGTDINDQDEYHGYTALHYAVILGQTSIVKVLLQFRARVNLQDNDSRTPLDHAALPEKSDVVQLLEKHGAKRNASEVLFKSAIEEQKKMKNRSTPFTKAKDASSAMAQGMNALRERGERLQQLEGKTSQLHNDASSYAELAKQMKEKNKKKR